MHTTDRPNAGGARGIPVSPRRIASAFVAISLLATCVLAAGAPEPITYSVAFTYRTNAMAEITAVIPTDKQDLIELMMPIWTPGYYRVENYAGQVRGLSARTLEGGALSAVLSRSNRWRVHTEGAPAVRVSYKLVCDQRSVTRNWVDPHLAVLNGAATFITLVEPQSRPHEVALEMPDGWDRSMTGLPAVPGKAHRYLAEDYHALVDSPILAGKLDVDEFEVAGSRHFLVNAGNISESWDNDDAVDALEEIVREHDAFWGSLPFERYMFLNVFRRSGGGLEHRNSTLLTVSPSVNGPSDSWYSLACHEYFHAFNVKRLRPTEFNTFDYECPPRTTGLWISEGLTTYYGYLLIARAGLTTNQRFISQMSSEIARLQNSPGRLVQSLEDSSLNVWETSNSGIARGSQASTISYYTKGLVVGFLLDAKIQRATGGKKSLDDVMRLAYARYSGSNGFTADQFRATAEEVAGTDLRDWFKRAVSSTEELDYIEMLDWYGLEFLSTGDQRSRLSVRSDATEEQKSRLQRLTAPSGRTAN